MTTKMKQKTTNWHRLALASIVVAYLTKSTEARGADLLAPRLYQYNRHQNPLADLMGDVLSMPVYLNSLAKQQEAQMERMHRSKPRYYLDESSDGSELVMEVPGVSADDLNVELEDGHMLHISGTRRFTQQGKTVESKFDQMFRMNDDADIDNISVSLSSGILRVHAPKKEKTIKKLPIVVNSESPAAIDATNAAEQGEDIKADSEADGPKVEEVDGLAITEEKVE